MDIFEIHFDTIVGVATRVESTSWHSLWKITVDGKYFTIRENYNKPDKYILLEFSEGLEESKIRQQIPNIFSQIEAINKSNRPKPPKRYR